MKLFAQMMGGYGTSLLPKALIAPTLQSGTSSLMHATKQLDSTNFMKPVSKAHFVVAESPNFS